jgi:hypothetical protein
MLLSRLGLRIGELAALRLGHDATQIYLHADMAINERALVRTTPIGVRRGRYQPTDALLAFLGRL